MATTTKRGVKNKWTYPTVYNYSNIHKFSSSASDVIVVNENPYGVVTLQYDAETAVDLLPGSISYRTTSVSQITLTAKSVPCNVSIYEMYTATVTIPDRSLSTLVGSAIRSNQALSARQSIMNYVGNAAPIIACRGNTAYKASSTKLYRSTDGGTTWSASLSDISTDYYTTGHIMANGTVIMFSNNGYVYRSTDGTTFTKLTSSPFDVALAGGPLFAGCDSNGTDIVFGEYNTTSTNYHLYTSHDSGATWSATLTIAGSTTGTIRHFHSVNYIDGVWYATTGDNDSYTQVKWYKSTNGDTWTLVDCANTNKWRALNVYPDGNGNLLWGSDSPVAGMSGLYKVAISALSSPTTTPTLLSTFPSTCWGLMGNGSGKLLAIGKVDTGDTASSQASIYASSDNGVTWHEDLRWDIKLPTSSYGGFTAIRYLSTPGSFVIGTNNLWYTTAGGASTMYSLYATPI